jgi:hypothetical protein
MDKPQNNPAATPGYETRDANVRGVFNFLVFLGVSLVVSALVCWGLFRYFSRRQAEPASASPFAETRQMSLGPQLQVNPREEWLKYREQQEQSLESFAWENRAAGIVRVPIERAMELLVQKGLPVQSDTLPTQTEKPAPPGSKKP